MGETSARQQAEHAHLQELNAKFDEHLQSYVKINSEQKGHCVAACVGENIKNFMNKGNEMETSFCKKSSNWRVAVLIALLGMIFIAQRWVRSPRSLRLKNHGSTR